MGHRHGPLKFKCVVSRKCVPVFTLQNYYMRVHVRRSCVRVRAPSLRDQYSRLSGLKLSGLVNVF